MKSSLEELMGYRPYGDVHMGAKVDPRARKDYERRHKFLKGMVDEMFITD